jgi:thymidine kinase
LVNFAALKIMTEIGKLAVFYGCMFAGKTTALLQYISDQNLKSNEFLVLKPAVDTRSGKATISTHDGKSHECLIYDQEFDIFQYITPFIKLIAIDEAQFFNKVFLSDLKRLMGKGINIVASGLDKDYLGRPFGLMPALISIANHQFHLKAKCESCGKDAEFTYRKMQNNVLILIGQDQYYEARCETCFKVY